MVDDVDDAIAGLDVGLGDGRIIDAQAAPAALCDLERSALNGRRRGRAGHRRGIGSHDAGRDDVVGQDRLQLGGVGQQSIQLPGGQPGERLVVGREDRERPAPFSVSTRPAT